MLRLLKVSQGYTGYCTEFHRLKKMHRVTLCVTLCYPVKLKQIFHRNPV